MKKSLFFKRHCIGIITLFFLTGTSAINEKNKLVDAPLLDTQQGTLVASIDMSNANDRIKAYISESIEMKMSELVKMKLQDVFGALKIDQDLKLYIENVKANLTLEKEIKKYVDGLKKKVPDILSEDECSDPYRRIGEGCYLIQKDTVSGDAAFAKCLLLGASLANFDTLNEAMLMKHELVRLNTGVHYFIGGRNIDRYKSGGDWRWIRKNGDMVKMTYFAFDSAEPDGTVGRSEDCMFFYAPRKYKFHSVWCENGSLLDKCSYPFRRVGFGCNLIQRDNIIADEAFAKCLRRGAYLANFETLNEAMLMKHELVRMNTGVVYHVGGTLIDISLVVIGDGSRKTEIWLK